LIYLVIIALYKFGHGMNDIGNESALSLVDRSDYPVYECHISCHIKNIHSITAEHTGVAV